MIRYQNKPFIRTFTENIIKLWLQEIENFRNYFMDACDGHSTARIAEAFMEK